MMSARGDIYSSENCSTAEDRLSSPGCEMNDWFTENSDILNDSSFFEFALAETNKKRRKLADGSAEPLKAKHTRTFKRDLAKKRRAEPDAYKLQKRELRADVDLAESDAKKQQQMIRNRISAQQSRDRKKAQFIDLEVENAELRQKLNSMETERRLLKHTLTKVNRSKLYRVFKGASMTMATFLSLCLLINSLHDTKEVSNALAQQLGEIDLQLYKDASGLSLHEKSSAIFQDLLDRLDLDSTDESPDGEVELNELALKSLISKPDKSASWLTQLEPCVAATKLPVDKKEQFSISRPISSIEPS